MAAFPFPSARGRVLICPPTVRSPLPVPVVVLAAALSLDADASHAQVPARPPLTDPAAAVAAAGEIRVRADKQEKVGPGPLPRQRLRGRQDRRPALPGRPDGRLRGQEARREHGPPGGGGRQRGLHPRRGAALRPAHGDGRHRQGLPGGRDRLRGAGRVRGRQAHRAPRRQALHDRRRALQLVRAAQPALGVLQLERGHQGGRPHHRQERGLQGQVRPRLLRALSSTTRSRTTSAPPASSSPISASPIPAGGTWAAASSGRWAGASTRPSTPTTTPRSATGSDTSSATPRTSPSRATFRTYVYNPTKIGGDLGLGPRLERAADAARRRAGDRQRASVQQPPLPAALPGQLLPRHHPHPPRVLQPAAELRGDHAPGAPRTPPAPTSARTTAASTSTCRRSACAGSPSGWGARCSPSASKAPPRTWAWATTIHGGPLLPLRRLAAGVAPPLRQLPAVHAAGVLPLHALGHQLHAGLRGPGHARGAGPRPLLLRRRGGRARPHLLPRVQHPRRRLHRPLQARDRPGDQLDLRHPGRRLQPDPEVRRLRLLPGHEPGQLRDRAALPGQAPLAGRGEDRPLRVPDLARLPDLLRADQRGPEQLRPQLLLERVRPRRAPSTSVRSSRACASGPPRCSARTSCSSTT